MVLLLPISALKSFPQFNLPNYGIVILYESSLFHKHMTHIFLPYWKNISKWNCLFVCLSDKGNTHHLNVIVLCFSYPSNIFYPTAFLRVPSFKTCSPDLRKWRYLLRTDSHGNGATLFIQHSGSSVYTNFGILINSVFTWWQITLAWSCLQNTAKFILRPKA